MLVFLFVFMKIVLLIWGTFVVVKQQNHIFPHHLMTPNIDIDLLKLLYADKHSDSIYSQELVPWITYTALWLKISPQHKKETALRYWCFFKNYFNPVFQSRFFVIHRYRLSKKIILNADMSTISLVA